jgi:hypothetical protein
MSENENEGIVEKGIYAKITLLSLICLLIYIPFMLLVFDGYLGRIIFLWFFLPIYIGLLIIVTIIAEQEKKLKTLKELLIYFRKYMISII